MRKCYLKSFSVLLTIVFISLATLVYAVSSPPELLNKLDEMFEWTKHKMGVVDPGIKRPKVFIYRAASFRPICEDMTSKDQCEYVLGMYSIRTNIIYVLNRDDVISIERTIIHEMTHAIQREKYGTKFTMDMHNREDLELEAYRMGDIYTSEKYGKLY